MLRPGFTSLKLISALGYELGTTFIFGVTKKGGESNGTESRPMQAREKKGYQGQLYPIKNWVENRGKPAVKEYTQ